MPRSNPYAAFNFTLSIPGVVDEDDTVAGFSDVSGLNTEITMAEYRTGADRLNHVRKIQAMHKVGDVTCKRGVVNSQVLWDWIDQARRLGPDAKKDQVVIKLRDEQGSVVQTWTLRSVAPTKWTGPTFNAKGGTDVAMEELVLSAESLDFGT